MTTHETSDIQSEFHYGYWVSSDTPITGVVSTRNVEWIYDETDYGAVTNLSYDGAWQEYLRERTNEWLAANDDDGSGSSAPDEDTIDQWRNEYGQMYEESGDRYLIGSWSFDEDTREWEVNRDASLADDDAFAAIVDYDWGGGIVHVVWSRYVTRAALCSPCCAGQCDLDTEGDYLAYDLPPSLYGDNRANTNQSMHVATFLDGSGSSGDDGPTFDNGQSIAGA